MVSHRLEVDGSHSAHKTEDVSATLQLDWVARQTQTHPTLHETAFRITDHVGEIVACLERWRAIVAAPDYWLSVRLVRLPIITIGTAKTLEV